MTDVLLSSLLWKEQRKFWDLGAHYFLGADQPVSSGSSVVQHDLRREAWLIDTWHVLFTGDMRVRFIPAWNSVDELTSLSQSVKADVRVKTVGFFTSLQTRVETKLVTPWMYHLPSLPRQFRGPPESPWVRDRNSVWSSWPFISDGNMFSICCCPHTHCIRTRRLLLHRPWCSWRCRPTSRCDCTHCAPPQAARPAAACQA